MFDLLDSTYNGTNSTGAAVSMREYGIGASPGAPTTQAVVLALAVWGSAEDVFIAGMFGVLHPSGRPAPRLIRWDASANVYIPLAYIAGAPEDGLGINKEYGGFAAMGGALYLGASITTFGNRSSAATPVPRMLRMQPPDFAPTAVPGSGESFTMDIRAMALVPGGGQLLVGGRSGVITGGQIIAAAGLFNGTTFRALQGVDGSALQGGTPTYCNNCHPSAVGVSPLGDVWFGGEMTNFGDRRAVPSQITAVNGIARYSLSASGQWTNNAPGQWYPIARGGNGMSDRVFALMELQGDLLIAGQARWAGATAIGRLFRWSPANRSFTSYGFFGTSATGPLRALLSCELGVIAAGAFTVVSVSAGIGIARIDASRPSAAVSSGSVGSNVSALVDVVTGFTGVSDEVRNLVALPAGSVARLVLAGTMTATTVPLPRGAVLIGGTMTSFVWNSTTEPSVDVGGLNGLAAWTGDRFARVGCSDGSILHSKPAPAVTALAVDSSGDVYVGMTDGITSTGLNISICGSIPAFLHRWRPSDGNWTPVADVAGGIVAGRVFAVAEYTLRATGTRVIVIGGRFSLASSVAAFNVVMYDPAARLFLPVNDSSGAQGVRGGTSLAAAFADVRVILAAPLSRGLILGGTFAVAGSRTAARNIVLWADGNAAMGVSPVFVPLIRASGVPGNGSSSSIGSGSSTDPAVGTWGAWSSDSSAVQATQLLVNIAGASAVQTLALLPQPAANGSVQGEQPLPLLAVGGSFAAVGDSSIAASHIALFNLSALPSLPPLGLMTPTATPTGTATTSPSQSASLMPPASGSLSATASPMASSSLTTGAGNANASSATLSASAPASVTATSAATPPSSFSNAPAGASPSLLATQTRSHFPSASATLSALALPSSETRRSWPADIAVTAMLQTGDFVPCAAVADILSSARAAVPPASASVQSQQEAAAAAPRLLVEMTVAVASGSSLADVVAVINGLRRMPPEPAATRLVCDIVAAAASAVNRSAWLLGLEIVQPTAAATMTSEPDGLEAALSTTTAMTGAEAGSVTGNSSLGTQAGAAAFALSSATCALSGAGSAVAAALLASSHSSGSASHGHSAEASPP